MLSVKGLMNLTLAAVWILSAAPAFSEDKGPTFILQKDVPYTITSPGSYVLDSNLVVTDPNVTAIVIAADHVTLDLNGFAIIGPDVGASGAGSGIDTQVQDHVVVKNGSVRGFFDPAAACVHLDGNFGRVDSVNVAACPQAAIFVGPGGIVRGCQVTNSGAGIDAAHGSIISGNTLFNMSNRAIGAGGDGGVTVVGNNCRESNICIQATTDGNRIEFNVLTASGVGLDLAGGADNYFARNFLQGNTTAVVGAADDLDGGTVDPALSNTIIP